MISWLNGRSCAPAATSRRSAAGFLASYFIVMSVLPASAAASTIDL
jgi:hypothetical protein